MKGLRPVVEFMTFNFAVLAADQILNHASKVRYMLGGQASVPIVFRGPNGSAGQLAATHSVAYDSMYAQFPGLSVIFPSEPDDAKGLLKSSIRNEAPVIFMEAEKINVLMHEHSEYEYDHIPTGKVKVKKVASDRTFDATGMMYHIAKLPADQ